MLQKMGWNQEAGGLGKKNQGLNICANACYNASFHCLTVISDNFMKVLLLQ